MNREERRGAARNGELVKMAGGAQIIGPQKIMAQPVVIMGDNYLDRLFHDLLVARIDRFMGEGDGLVSNTDKMPEETLVNRLGLILNDCQAIKVGLVRASEAGNKKGGEHVV